MKMFLRKKLLPITILLSVTAFTGCEQNDNDRDYGFPKIYIPQATITGLDNSYPIPAGPFGQSTSYTCHFRDGKLNIAIGAVRAGVLADQKAFTVDLSVSQEETDRKLKELNEKGTPAAEFPSDVYSFPEKISIDKGKNTGTCYVAVDMEKLSRQQAALYENGSYRLLVLGLEISNPTNYELADTNTSVIIILDLNSVHWDNVAENLPESEVRALFPLL